jgi:hypothetical protein
VFLVGPAAGRAGGEVSVGEGQAVIEGEVVPACGLAFFTDVGLALSVLRVVAAAIVDVQHMEVHGVDLWLGGRSFATLRMTISGKKLSL